MEADNPIEKIGAEASRVFQEENDQILAADESSSDTSNQAKSNTAKFTVESTQQQLDINGSNYNILPVQINGNQDDGTDKDLLQSMMSNPQSKMPSLREESVQGSFRLPQQLTQYDNFFRDKVLSFNNQVIQAFFASFDALHANIDQDPNKQRVIGEILDTLKTFDTIDFGDKDSKKIVKLVLKDRILQDEEIFIRFKKLILLRDRDRSTRENSVKVLKKLIKFSKKACQIMLKLKLCVFISFILEREYKHPQVVKERLQCFKLIQTWLERDPQTFPYLFGQTVASIARNPEDQQLRKMAIETILNLCQEKPAMGASIGGVKIMVDALLDVNLAQQGIIRQDLIAHSLLMMINNPETRIYLRPFKDLNRIFSIFTQADGVDKDPRKDILEKIQLQLCLVSKTIINMIRTSHGLIYISSSPLGLASLIGALNQPIKMYKQLAILNLFIEIFDVPLYVGGNFYLQSTSTSHGCSQNLLNNYVALLLQAFYHCGISEALIRVGITTDENSELNRKSRFLLKKIMYLSSNLLPEVPQIALLVNIATDFDQNFNQLGGNCQSSQDNIKRSRATKIIKELSEISLRNPLEIQHDNELFQQNLSMLQINNLLQQGAISGINSNIGMENAPGQILNVNHGVLTAVAGTTQNIISSPIQSQFTEQEFPELFMKTYQYFNQMSTGQSMHYQQQIISNFQLDLQQYYYTNEIFFDHQKLENKIQATKVLKSRDYLDWDFTVILELFENDGVIWNEERLDYYMYRTKFFKNLVNFYMPSKERFVKLDWKQENLIYASVGYLLLKTLLMFESGQKNLIGKNPILYFTPGAIFEDDDNPFHQKKSFIQDVEEYIEKEFMMYQNNKLILKQKSHNKLMQNQVQGFGQADQDNQIISISQIGQPNERFFGETRLNEKMFREVISWLGLFTQNKETLSKISKKFPLNNQSQIQKQQISVPQVKNTVNQAIKSNMNIVNSQIAQTRGELSQIQNIIPQGGVSGQVQLTKSIKQKNKSDNIFGYLKGLVDKNGYYDHLLQIVIHSFYFGINSPLTRDLLNVWSSKCSPSLSKIIIEAYRQIFRQQNIDFYVWCLEPLCSFLFIGDEETKKSALSVLEETCYDEISYNFLIGNPNIQNLIKMQCDLLKQEKIYDELREEGARSANKQASGQSGSFSSYSTDMDIFISKFLRSEKGFSILKENGWLDHKIKDWNKKGGIEYITRLERNIYEGLNINQLNSLVQTHAMSIWIPIYEHSSDFRNEITTLKKFPFQIIVKIEHLDIVLIQESLQTYIEIDESSNTVHQQQVQILGNVTKMYSNLSKLPLEGHYFVSACLKLGSQYINHQCKEAIEPQWIKTDLGEQDQMGSLDSKYGINRFKIIRNGVHFQFGKYYGALGEKQDKNYGAQNSFAGSSAKRLQTFLEQVVFKVQIQPQKYKVSETPVHLFGELIKTSKGTELIRQRSDVQDFRAKLLLEATPSQEKRSILWTLGHIGAEENGMKLLLETSVVKDIIEMAENSQILSLRGTCIYTIGMMCRTPIGRREIQKHNWLFSKSQVASGSVSVSLPRNPKNLFKVETNSFQGSITCQTEVFKNMKELKMNLPLNKEEDEILLLIGNLINGVTWQQAYNDLSKLQEKNPKAFMNAKLFEHSLLFMSMYNRLQPKTRKFIFNLFDQLIFGDKLLKERYVII